MGIVSGYTLDLYCDGGDDCPLPSWKAPDGQFYGETFTECARNARRAGWFIDVNGDGRERGRALCPDCKRRLMKRKGSTVTK